MTVAEQIRYEKYKRAYDAFIVLYPFTLEDLDGEQWRDIADYEGFYQISTFGRVKSFCRGKVTILKPILQKFGYLVVDLYKYGHHKSTNKPSIVGGSIFRVIKNLAFVL